jgi:hypothetical protein
MELTPGLMKAESAAASRHRADADLFLSPAIVVTDRTILAKPE